MTRVRIATFNLENLDDKPEPSISLDERIEVIRPQLLRLNADILCLQEVNGQEQAGQPRSLLALKKLLEETPYADVNMVSTKTVNNPDVYDERNLVVVSRFPIEKHKQYKHDSIDKPVYKRLTADPPEDEADDVTWERPFLYAVIKLDNGSSLHLINLHLKSRIPANIPGQKKDSYIWKTVPGWAEGYFLSSIKRVGQALEVRVFIDNIFDQSKNSQIVVCGDFNADLEDVPVATIRGRVEDTGNGDLALREMLPCEKTIPESSRYSLFHRGRGMMYDHLLISRSLLPFYRKCELHNEMLHDESIAFATDKKYPESDHAPVVSEFEF